MTKRPISADSHVTEPPSCYIDNIERAFLDRAPRVVRDEKQGDVFVIEGMKGRVAMGLIAAAGKPSEELAMGGGNYDTMHKGGWDAKARLADQDRDGVAGEVLYASVGMLLNNHPDTIYKQACFEAYNRWLQGFCSDAPTRVFGLGQTALRSPEEGVRDLRKIREMGFVGVMMPGNPGVSDYDDPVWDPVWEAAVDLKLPLSFHILTSKDEATTKARGPRINGFQNIIRGCQDILGIFVFGGVFDRHPDLKIVCAEADAGWAPHYMYRADHAYKRHRHWMNGRELQRMPSDYFRENIYMTFQDDWSAFRVRHLLNIERLMWASDFPHSDSTWPNSRQVLAEQTADLTSFERDRITHDNVRELYGLVV